MIGIERIVGAAQALAQLAPDGLLFCRAYGEQAKSTKLSTFGPVVLSNWFLAVEVRRVLTNAWQESEAFHDTCSACPGAGAAAALNFHV